MSSIFDIVEKGPAIEVFALNKAFLEDQDSKKINLGEKQTNDNFSLKLMRIILPLSGVGGKTRLS
jgi:hypothetical protein